MELCSSSLWFAPWLATRFQTPQQVIHLKYVSRATPTNNFPIKAIASVGGVNWATKVGGIVNVVLIHCNAYLISTNILECNTDVDVGSRINRFYII
jgi:hypothetical protein